MRCSFSCSRRTPAFSGGVPLSHMRSRTARRQSSLPPAAGGGSALVSSAKALRVNVSWPSGCPRGYRGPLSTVYGTCGTTARGPSIAAHGEQVKVFPGHDEGAAVRQEGEGTAQAPDEAEAPHQ